MKAVHKQHATRLKEISWPIRLKVGDEASEAAWLIVQHSIGDSVYMKSCYALLQQASDDVKLQYLAYLFDRICFFKAKPQKHGTQFDDRGLYPVADKNEVNMLR